ncbi:MAG: cyclic pyranopterin monophosphate synthase MoaC [Parvularculaceae bacterium]|nr:cyclic pyranopterin monophosphate synthase MoaC [Parvularculaceae bacterium]
MTHFDADGRAQMVDVSEKHSTIRIAKASGAVGMSQDAIRAVKSGKTKKGDVCLVAELAGITGAKKTSNLIPLCHPVELTSVNITTEIDEENRSILVTATVKTTGRTGVEMEALTAVSVACLTIYDMLKAADKGMIIRDVALVEKMGGKSGHWKAAGAH